MPWKKRSGVYYLHTLERLEKWSEEELTRDKRLRDY